MSDQILRTNPLPHKSFNQFFHPPDIGHPAAEYRLLVVYDIGTRLKAAGAAFTDEANLLPFSGTLDSDQAGNEPSKQRKRYSNYPRYAGSEGRET